MRYFLFCIFIGFTSFTDAQVTNSNISCSILHQGKFKYLDIPDTTAYVVINKENQTEYHNNGKYLIKSSLIWLDDCQYQMTMLSNTIPNFPFKAGDVMTVTINKVNGDIIYYTADVKGQKWDGRLLKIQD